VSQPFVVPTQTVEPQDTQAHHFAKETAHTKIIRHTLVITLVHPAQVVPTQQLHSSINPAPPTKPAATEAVSISQ